MIYRTESRYHYTYTLCIIIEADFQDGDLYRNSSTMRMCLTRLFTYDGFPGGLSYALEQFLIKEKDTVNFTKGSQKAGTQIINVQLIDQNKVIFTKEENEESSRELTEELKKLETFEAESIIH
jgi:hypothetical protein